MSLNNFLQLISFQIQFRSILPIQHPENPLSQFAPVLIDCHSSLDPQKKLIDNSTFDPDTENMFLSISSKIAVASESSQSFILNPTFLHQQT